MKNLFKRRVLQRRPIDIPRNPIIVKHGRRNFIVVHIIGCTSDPGVIPSALPDKLEEVVYAGENVVHENDGFKVFVFGVAEVVEGPEGGITYLRKVLDAVVECPAGAHGCSDGDT